MGARWDSGAVVCPRLSLSLSPPPQPRLVNSVRTQCGDWLCLCVWGCVCFVRVLAQATKKPKRKGKSKKGTVAPADGPSSPADGSGDSSAGEDRGAGGGSAPGPVATPSKDKDSSRRILDDCGGIVLDEQRWRKKQGISDDTKVSGAWGVRGGGWEGCRGRGTGDGGGDMYV
jgi:hypothetical protein